MRFILILICITGVVGCPTAPSVSGTTSLLQSDGKAPEYIAITRVVTHDGQSYLSHRLRDTSPFQIVQELPGAHVASSTGLWKWTVEDVEVTQADCDCFMERFNQGQEPGPDECRTTKTVQSAAMVNIDTGASWTPWDAGEDMNESEWSVTYTFHGALASVAFVSMCVDVMACGAAHPSYFCEYATVDLEGPRVVEPTVFAKPVENPLDYFESKDDLAPETIELTGVLPVFGKDEVTLRHHYTAPTCYACSDGKWSAYTASGFVDGQPVRGPFGKFAGLPAAVRELAQSGDIVGYGQVVK